MSVYSLFGSGLRMATSERTSSRIAVSFAANVARAGVSFMTGLVVARLLGPAGYGDYSFLLASTLSIATMFDCGTSSAFFTGVARRPRGSLFFRLYGAWHAAQILVPIVAFGFVLPAAVTQYIWPGQDRLRVVLAFGASFLMNQTWNLLTQLAESRRKTFLAQTTTIVQVVSHLAAVLVAAALGWLRIETILALLVIEYVILTVVLGPRLVRLSVAPSEMETRAVVLNEFVTFCRPLVIVSIFSMIYAFADRWMLQRFSGSVQQGIFSIGQQFAAIGLVLTTSLVKVFWKEIAEARERADAPRVARLYRGVTRTLYLAVAWLCCLLIPYCREILTWTLGDRFAAGWVCLLLMFLYPVHQALGQVQATFFFASGTTRAYSRIGMLQMLFSVPTTYILLAPASGMLPGLHLGANGLALKMVIVQWFTVALQSHAIAAEAGWSTDYRFEALGLVALFLLGWCCRWLSAAGLARVGIAAAPVRVAVGCLLYVAATAAVTYWSGAVRHLRPTPLAVA